MGFRFSLRWCSTGGGPRGRCPPSWAGTRFFFGAAPLQEQVVRLGSSLLPMGGPTRPTPGVPFVSRRKEPKACRGCAPGPPLGGIIIPPAARACMRLLLPPERVCATNPDRFATLSLWANRSFFLPRFLRGHTFWFQAVARQVGELRVRVASALDRGQGLPIFLSLIQGKLLDTRWGVRAVHSRKGLIRRQDTADRVLTTNNDNQGGQDFFSPIYPLLSIFLFYI